MHQNAAAKVLLPSGVCLLCFERQTQHPSPALDMLLAMVALLSMCCMHGACMGPAWGLSVAAACATHPWAQVGRVGILCTDSSWLCLQA